MTQRDSDRDDSKFFVRGRDEGLHRPASQQQAFGGGRRQQGGHPIDERARGGYPTDGQQGGSYGTDFGPPGFSHDDRFGGDDHFQGGRGGGGYSRAFAEHPRDDRLHARASYRDQAPDDWRDANTAYGGYGAPTARARGGWDMRAGGDERYPGEREAAERHAARNAYEGGRSASRHHVAGAEGGDWAGPGRDDDRWGARGGGDEPRGAYDDRQGAHHGAHHHDADYLQWRAEQLRRLDEDYRQWREARYRRFSDEFNQWREQRATGRGPTADNPALSGMQGTDTTGRADGLRDTEAPPTREAQARGQGADHRPQGSASSIRSTPAGDGSSGNSTENDLGAVGRMTPTK